MEVDQIIAENLRNIREQKGLSLGQLAEKTGLSKVMLSKLEKGGGNPTINNIWKIAHALDIPYTALLESTEHSAALIKQDELPVQRSEDGHYRLRCYYAFSVERNFEWFQMELDPGCQYRSAGHGPHTFEYLLVQSGVLQIEIKDKHYLLQAGDAISFRASEPHIYSNRGETVVNAYVTNYYPL
ncbi:MAG: XRE family transcriptional regulator [Acidaminococcus sp.]|jgi:transcriptional regulator with XRE-family HTH domain|nr:XRE family transcriptional regulator [Acidaminococcus sp.]MCI2099632.1 XRE family transcriptional regulator [Acidaminococcus sp.]MCI2113717.1 XRE family transcriptional regulator [Acidaminococcus sp.]MCI2115800.1 XRE family transcriptional regulator [Acidaminococcus sp.]